MLNNKIKQKNKIVLYDGLRNNTEGFNISNDVLRVVTYLKMSH